MSVVVSLLQVTINKFLFERLALASQVALLTSVHFLSTYCIVYVLSWWCSFDSKYLGIAGELKLGLVHATFVYLSQVSLAYNSLSLYQVSRLLVTPCTVLLKFCMYREITGKRRVIALGLIVYGCALVTAPDLSVRTNFVGAFALVGAIPAASLAQVWCAQYQKELSTAQFLLNWTRSAGCFLLIWALASGEVDTQTFADIADPLKCLCVIISCCVACLVNFSGTLVISRIDALGFQVLGCLKMICIVSAGVLLFGDAMTITSFTGCLITVIASIMYAENTMVAEIRPYFTGATICLVFISTLNLRMDVSSFFLSSVTDSVGTTEQKEWGLVACAMARMDAHLLQSWVLWNHVAGIEHFIIMNNNDISPSGMRDQFFEAVEPLIQRGLVTVQNYYKDVMNNFSLADEYGLNRSDYESLFAISGENCLKKRCYDLYAHRAKWLAMLDVDEVVVSINGRSLLDYLEQPLIRDNLHIGGLGILWRIVHYSEHFLKPKAIDAFEPYKLCDRHPSERNIKTIVRGITPGSIAPVMDIKNAHYMDYNDGYYCVLENSLTDITSCDPTKTLYNSQWLRPKSAEFQLNHHFSRSFEEFLLKSMRGMHLTYEMDSLREDFAVHQMCTPIVDGPTVAAATAVRRLRQRMHLLSESPSPGSLTGGKFSWPSQKYDVVVRAIEQRQDWNATFYLNNNTNASCIPHLPQDSFIHFWMEGYDNRCQFQFD
ncbi:Domain of unknown function DUF23 [Ostreococcus tauri]|uniref:Uncharacterized protein n=1 Tax=Ostreococcus tauri TaxID=70448 RepID=A0A096PBG4_OSTTA|nr:Domain of unknown function DUF23 [Ostreococcus tauri]CEG01931.1 Domain of unknown function DUF23 [Ostreococcus tauri]|eukprot:XP_022841258.1 Domain of unknown function DUF23 [Ostreococcus tauri]